MSAAGRPASRSLEEVRAWRGREAVDADGATAGAVVGEHWPDWLEVERTGGSGEIVLVPLAGAEPAGRAVRLALTGDAVLRAPAVEDPGAPTEIERARLAVHYERPRPAPADAEDRPEQAVRRRAVVGQLREAVGWERAAVRRFGALTSAADAEIAHGATLQRQTAAEHLQRIEAQLRALPARRPAPLSGPRRVAKARDTVGAVREARSFALRKVSFYAELETLARGAGDAATAGLAAAHRADDEATAETLAGSIPRLESAT